ERLRDRDRLGFEPLLRGLRLRLDVASRFRGAPLEPPLGHARFARALLLQVFHALPRFFRELGILADLLGALDLVEACRILFLVAAKRELVDELAAGEELLGAEQLERALAEQHRSEAGSRH